MLSTLPLSRTRSLDRARSTTARGAFAALALAAALLGALPSAAPAQQTAKASPEKAPAAGSSTQSIVVLVNDEPITGYEIDERMKIALLGASQMQQRLQKKLKSPDINEKFKAFAIKRLKENPPKSEAEQQARVKQLQGQFVQSIKDEVEKEFRPEARKEALDELIEERLKLQEAKRLNVVAGTDAVDRVIAGMAERNKMTPEQFAEHVGKMGANISAMRERIKASLSWGDVIRRRFGHQIATAGRELDKMTVAVTGGDDVELHVHRILLPLPAKADQKQVAQRLSDAERLRAGFTDCKATASLAASVSGARFDDLGERRPASVPEPTRSLLLSAGDNQMLPPSIGESGVEVWVLCGRKAVKAEEQKQATAETDVRQKEFEILSKKHLKDLRQDAHIEFR
jgi:peptidyl-prolyl cis-trans isomerase SurA